MQRRMREWQKKIVMASRTMMKRMWISWPMSRLVRAIARSVKAVLACHCEERLVNEGTYKLRVRL
jgi:hypothetical protein